MVTSPAFSFDIEPWPPVIGDAVAPHPGGALDQQARRVDLGGDVGQHLLDALLCERGLLPSTVWPSRYSRVHS